MPQRTEESCIVRRDLSAGAHISSLGLHEQIHHEQKFVLNGSANTSVISPQIPIKWPVLAVQSDTFGQSDPVGIVAVGAAGSVGYVGSVGSLGPLVPLLDRLQPVMLNLQILISR